jgi:hypothetical protein
MDRKYLTIGIIVFVILIVFLSGYINETTQEMDDISGCINETTQEMDDTGSTVVLTVGQREGSFLIQKINPDSVDGLWYLAYPVPREEGEPRTLRIGDDIGYACEGVSEKLTSIDFSGQKVTFTKIVGKPPLGGCPICLSGNTLIDTPNGNINVKELKRGMPIWTADSFGYRQPAIILKIGKAQVPPTHKMVHIVLDDGRELFVSPAHPTADSRIFGNINSGDAVDNSYVKSVELVPYGQGYTYDILPSGDTGFYWANEILVGSTLE